MNEENKTLTEDTTPDTAAGQTPGQEEKTFTQAEVDEIISKRLARAAKGTPTAEEMKEFKAWKKAQQTEAEKFAELDANYKAAQAELAAMRNQQAVTKSECRAEFVEFVADRVGRMDGEDFEKNLAEFKKRNPQYFGTVATAVRQQASSPSLTAGSGTKKTPDETMNDLIRKAWKH